MRRGRYGLSGWEVVDTPTPDTTVLEMVCGKGGYVRSIARDLGRSLGCLGHVAWLRRTHSGPFDLSDSALTWSEDVTAEMVEGALLPLEAGLAGLPRCICDETTRGPLMNGMPFRC